MSNHYVILPLSGDLNRGDQALVWQTYELINETDPSGVCYAIAEKEHFSQSEQIGLIPLKSPLFHPGRRDSGSKHNVSYGLSLKVKWGLRAILDFLKSSLLLHRTTRKWGMRYLDAEQKRTVKLLQSARAAYVKGGGFMHSYGGSAAPYTIYYTMFNIMLAQALGTDVYIMPNSFGPFRGLFVKSMLEKVIRKSKRCYCRESASAQNVLDSMGMKLPIYPDMGFLLQKEDNGDISRASLQLPSEKQVVAVTARPYRFPYQQNGPELYRNYLEAMRSFTQSLIDQGYYILFVEHTRAVREHESDISAIQAITAELTGTDFSALSNEHYTCRHLKAVYALCDYIVGTRFHSDIFAMAEGVPAIAISYEGHKSVGIMEDIGLPELCLPMDQVTAPLLLNRFSYLVQNQESVRAKLRQYNAFVRDEARRILLDVMSDKDVS